MISYFFQLQTMLYKWRFKFLLTISKWFPSVSIFNHCWGTFWCIWKKTVDAFPTDWLSAWKFHPYCQLCNNWCSASWILLLEPNQCFIWWTVYYLGVFSYASNVTNNSERTYRMARLDGMITLASMTGTLLSPYVFMNLGYYGNYISSSVLFFLATGYLIFFVKEPI